MVALTEAQIIALTTVRAAWPETDLILIGALALGHHIDVDYRDTEDLDFAVAISLDELLAANVLPAGWERDSKMEHRFYSPQGQRVDILPAGQDLIARGYVEWPSGAKMSLVGFDLAFEHSTTETIGDATVSVPSAAALTFLKMRAWLDRPAEREKDLFDLAYLFDRYVGEHDARRWADDVSVAGLNFEDVSPFVLGRDLAAIMQPAHRTHVDDFLAKLSPAHLAALGPFKLRPAEYAERALGAFRRGLDEG